MYEGMVVKAFIDRLTRKVYKPLDTYRSQDIGRMEYLAEKGRVEFDRSKAGQNQGPNLSNGGAGASSDPGQDQDSRLKHVGGGYYELPDGTKVRGKEAAVEALKAAESKE